MTMIANRVVALCERNAYVLREDLALMQSGQLKLFLLDADVTDDYAERLGKNLQRLEEIIKGCGCHCV